ncbi:hypothetical protein ACLOJK_035766 [Asimina triloba]
MFGAEMQRDISRDFESLSSPYWMTNYISRKANVSVKFQDIYGFTVEGNVDDVNVLNEVRERVRTQARVWWSLESSKGANWYLEPQFSSLKDEISVSKLKLSVVANTITLRRLIRKGIPPVLRPKVWLSISGAAKKRSTAPESYYDDLIKAVEGKVTAAARQIDHDLPRTFPGHPYLDTPEGHAALRRVLVGYSFRDSDVGYCQAMMKTEEDAFWMLAVLLEDVLVSDCYTYNLSGCHVEQRVFKDLLSQKYPRMGLTTDGPLPEEGVGTSQMREEELLMVHQLGDVISILQKTTHHLFDPDDLLTVAFEQIGSLTTNAIAKQRKKQESAVMAELDERDRRLNCLNPDDGK